MIQRLTTLLVLLILIGAHSTFAEEGMWPMSEIHKLNLKAAGLEIEPEQIYNPDSPSLIDAIVKIGGCTGSFVSPGGLILTNHHCAYGAARAASDKANDYIQNGFIARNQTEEIRAEGFTVRITESYRDISDEVLAAVDDTMDLAVRTKAIEKKMKEIVVEAEKQHPGKRAEVAEMFIGKVYVLFIYTYLKDVRLVYFPPRSIGEFGGEVDNWMWPRHTGDFAFMRVYVAPDGSSAEFSPENVPYRPKKYLQVSPEGVNEEDFVFIFGYPGRTYRHQTSHYLAYEQEIRMPYVAQFYDWQISVMEKMGESDRSIAIKHLSRIKGLSNTMKNYRGKLKGLKRLKLVDRKRLEEEALQNFIEADPTRRQKYSTILQEIGEVYHDLRERAQYELLLTYLTRSVYMLRFAYTVYEAALELEKPDVERESAYMERNFSRTKQSLELALKSYYEPTDKIILKEMLMRAIRLPQGQRIDAMDNLMEGENPETSIDSFIESAYAESRLNDEDFLMKLFSKSPEAIKKLNDPFIKLAEALYPTYQELKEVRRKRKGALDQLYARLIDVKKEFLQKDFIPDANGTLRLTYGRIRGYSPADAVYYHPLTTLQGVIEKNTGVEPFNAPQRLIDLWKAKDFGQFEHPKLNSVPVAILYNMDTTGGNSGSPIMNARGELVGVNFDRAFEATINDYAWSEEYSRSIGVDIRYVLWVTQTFAGAVYLLKEMNVPLGE